MIASTAGIRKDWPGSPEGAAPGDAEALLPGEYAQFPEGTKLPLGKIGPDEILTDERATLREENRQFHHHAGGWFGRTPNGLLGNFAHHDSEEHGDGTVSIPNISLGTMREDGEHVLWVGRMERGVWIGEASRGTFDDDGEFIPAEG